MYRNNTKKDFLFYEAIRFPSLSRKEEQNDNPTRHSQSYARGVYLKEEQMVCSALLGRLFARADVLWGLLGGFLLLELDEFANLLV